MNPDQQRKLCAILFADIANYSAVMQEDEHLGRTYLAKFRDTLYSSVEHFDGEIIQFYGDGVVCVFKSSVAALRCAKALQTAFLADPIVPVRVGLHAGDVFFEAGNVYGDSVNLASRIESAGIPGSVLYSERIYLDTKNHQEFKPLSLGKIALKNIASPPEVFALNQDGLTIPEKAKIKATAPPKNSMASSIYSKWIIGLLFTVLMVWFIIRQIYPLLVPQKGGMPVLAVLNFENNTGITDQTLLGKVTADRIMHGIAQNNLATVMTEKTVTEYTQLIKASTIPSDPMESLHREFAVENVINGNIYLDQNELVFECMISDAGSRVVIEGFDPVRCPVTNPMQGIEELKQRILGYLALQDDVEDNLLLETHIPKFEAYQALMKSKSAEDNEEMLYHLNRALEIDSQYFEPMVLRISGHYNLEEFEVADSLLQQIDQKFRDADPRQENLLLFYDALLKGKNDLAFHYMNQEYILAPFDLQTNNTMIVLALQFINDVDKANQFYQKIPEKLMDYGNCANCRSRLFTKILLDLARDRPDLAIQSGELLFKYDPDWAYNLLIKAYILEGQWDDLDGLLTTLSVNNPEEMHAAYYLKIIQECRMVQKNDRFLKYLEKAKRSITVETPLYIQGEIAYLNNDLNQAEAIFQKAMLEDPTDPFYSGFLAGILLTQDREEEAHGLFQKMTEQIKPYQYGEIDYQIARAYAVGGNSSKALEHLQKSIAQGRRYIPNRFQHDYRFKNLLDDGAFKKILSYWK